MNKTLLIHAIWIVAAVAAFFLGSRFPVGEEPGEPPVASRTPSAVAGDERTGAGGISKPGGPKSGGRRASDEARGGGRPALSDGEVESLGERFRTARNPIERRLAFSDLLEGLTAENALLVRAQIEHMDHRSAEFREFHYAWGAVDGLNATVFGAETKEDDMSPALAGWASADPGAASAWFEQLDMANDARFDALLKDRKIPEEQLRNHLMRGLVQGLADADPDAATEFVRAAAEGGNEAAYGMMHTIVEAVMRTDDPAQAALWAGGLEAGPLRNSAMERVADHYARRDLEAATEWATQLSGQPEGAGVVAQVGANMARRDPQAALGWLYELPAGAGQNAGMRRVMGEWTGRDPTAASQYLTSLPASEARDAAISGFSQRLAWEDPQSAITWAQTITSEEQRNQTLMGAGRAWARKDAATAAGWAASAGLPQAVQQAFANPPQRERD